MFDSDSRSYLYYAHGFTPPAPPRAKQREHGLMAALLSRVASLLPRRPSPVMPRKPAASAGLGRSIRA